MIYTLISLPFLALTAAAVLASRRRPRFAERMRASVLAAAVLLMLTAIFDNVMIGAGLVAYPEGTSSGIRIGLAPIEDFSYALCAAFGVPAIAALLPERRRS